MTPPENMPQCQTLTGSMPVDYVLFHEVNRDLFARFSTLDLGPDPRQDALTRVRDVLKDTLKAHLARARDVLENTRRADGSSVAGPVLERDGESPAVKREDGVPEDMPEDASAPSTCDPSSFEAFYTRYASRCTKHVSLQREYGWWPLAGHSPEDIAQDAFMVVMRNWDRVSRMDYPYAYLRKVADNLLERAFAQAAQYYIGDFEDSESWDRSAWHEQDLDEGVVTSEMFRQLVEELPERQAQVLVLYSLQYTDSGIGELLGMAPATVRSHRRHLVNYANRTGWKEDGASAAA